MIVAFIYYCRRRTVHSALLVFYHNFGYRIVLKLRARGHLSCFFFFLHLFSIHQLSSSIFSVSNFPYILTENALTIFKSIARCLQKSPGTEKISRSTFCGQVLSVCRCHSSVWTSYSTIMESSAPREAPYLQSQGMKRKDSIKTLFLCNQGYDYTPGQLIRFFTADLNPVWNNTDHVCLIDKCYIYVMDCSHHINFARLLMPDYVRHPVEENGKPLNFCGPSQATD